MEYGWRGGKAPSGLMMVGGGCLIMWSAVATAAAATAAAAVAAAAVAAATAA